MSITSKSIVVLTISSLFVIALSLGGGYLAGTRSRATSQSEASTRGGSETVPPVSTPQNVDQEMRASDAAAAAAETARTSDTAAVMAARLQDLGAERVELLNEARGLLRSGASFDQVRPILAKIDQLDTEAIASLTDLEAAEYEKVMGALMSSEAGALRDWAIGTLFFEWGKLNPQMALEFADSAGKYAMRGVFRGWGATDPSAALVHQKEIAAADQQAGRDALLRIFDGRVWADPAAAIAGLESLDFDDQKTAFRAFDDALQSESRRPGVLAAVADVADEALRADLVHDFSKNWGRVAPLEAMEWYETIPFDNPLAALPAADEIVRGMLQADRAGEGADWIWPKLPDAARTEFLNEFVLGEWANKDRPAAEQWHQEHRGEVHGDGQ